MMMKTLIISREQDVICIGEIPDFIAAVLEHYSKLGFSQTSEFTIQIEHQVEVERASLNGELIGRNPLTRIKEPFAIGDHLKRQVITIEEANQYMKKFKVELKYRPLPIESGRYTLEEAAIKISTETGQSESEILESLLEAVRQDDLVVYKPGSDVIYKPATVRGFYEEIYWDDLNNWMRTYLPRLNFSFPKPASGVDRVSTDRSHNSSQENINLIDQRAEKIVSTAKERFTNPLKIPDRGKSDIRNHLCSEGSKLFTKSTFDAAWKEARKKNLVKMQNHDDYITGR